MNILYIATSFPKPDVGATIYTDLAEALHESGHNITVAVSEQPKNIKNTQMNQERGFNVLRIVTGNYYDVNIIEKGITTLRIPRLMKKGISNYLKDDNFDFILYEAPPVTNANLIKWAKKKFNCPSYLMLKDIFPQNAVDIGIMKKYNPIHYYFSRKEKSLYESASIIGCMSKANRDYVLNHNPWIDSDKVQIFPNTKKITDTYHSDSYKMRQRCNIPIKSRLFLFGGNMGKPQNIDLLCRTIKHYKTNEDIYFLFVGRGTERYKLEETIAKYSISNAQVIENLPRDEYEQITKESDIGMIILDPRFTIPNYPSRILSYMEYAKPILAATDANTDINELIEDEAECGKWVESGSDENFYNAINILMQENNLKKMGLNGRKYIENNLRVKKSVTILEENFN